MKTVSGIPAVMAIVDVKKISLWLNFKMKKSVYGTIFWDIEVKGSS